MSTGLIIVIVVVVIILIAIALAIPRMRERARMRARERELGQRREQVVDEHRDAAGQATSQAEQAQQRARIAEQEAERARAEAQLQEQHAQMHEQGMADDQLIREDEREHFAGTSAVPENGEGAAPDEGQARPGAAETPARAADRESR